MRTLTGIISSLVFLATAATASPAQQDSKAIKAGSADITVTAFASPQRVRFTAAPSVVQIRLEVYDSAGRKLFDNELRAGNVLDWHLQDGQAELLADDTYLCIVTVKNLSGRITQRIGSVKVEKNSASLQPVDASQISAQQAQAIGPIEENASLTVVKDDDNPTTTVIAHDGVDGQITRGRGALSFRIGDFFSGKDAEQMRLTPEGNLGIGITHPQARLDVDGVIRASQGIMFPDGTIQTTAAIAGNATQGTTGQPQIGPGSKPIKLGKASGRNGKGQNTVSPEFMVDEDLTVNGSIFFTTGFPRDLAMLNNTGGVRIYAAPTLTNSPASAAIQFFGTASAFTGQAYIDSGAHDNAAVIFRTAQTGGTIAERMRITATGNIGIGKTNPQTKLDVAGDINTTTQFNIGGSRVFSVNGGNVSANGVGPVVNSNTFGGTDAGASVIPDASTAAGNFNTFFGVKAGTNTANGCCNSFFGNLVGLKNTTGHSNAFFGGAAGIGNTTGSFNSFFGDGAGSDSWNPNVARTGSLNTFIGSLSGGGVTTGSSNTFLGANTSGTSNLTNATAIGANAAVTQSNSLVLGNGFANVGIGTSAPLTKLDVRGDLVLDNGGNPTLYTSVASTEQNRYLKLINSPSVASASGLKAGGILVADDYGYGFPTKNDLIVKGFVGIGLGANVAPANPLHVAGDIRIGTGFTGCVLDAGGTIIAGTCSSDVRLKRDIVPFVHLLDKVAQLQPVHFYWRAEEFKERHFGTKPSYGLIAQEVEKVLPELVTEDEQGYKAVNYAKLPLLSLQAIKELKAENDALKQKLSDQQASAALQQQQLQQQQQELAAIKRLLCLSQPQADLCKAK